MSWDAPHYEYSCSDGKHSSFWKTVVESPQWTLWMKEQQKRFRLLREDKLPKKQGAYDIDEVTECGWISQEHFQDFLRFCAKVGKKKSINKKDE